MASIIEKAQKKARLLAQKLAERKASQKNERIVFAESCTAGLVSALMGQVPGISEFLCGSAVAYRESIKRDWLGVCGETIEEFTSESAETTQAMAVKVLERTEEATCSAAVTGHLGPDAPPRIDGKVYVVVAAKDESGQIKPILLSTFQLQTQQRFERQYEAATRVIESVLEFVSGEIPIGE